MPSTKTKKKIRKQLDKKIKSKKSSNAVKRTIKKIIKKPDKKKITKQNKTIKNIPIKHVLHKHVLIKHKTVEKKPEQLIITEPIITGPEKEESTEIKTSEQNHPIHLQLDSTIQKNSVHHHLKNSSIDFDESIKKSPYERQLKKAIKLNLLIILYFSLLGAIISAYFIYSHYAQNCTETLTTAINCSSVNNYSEILGIPVAVFAFIAFIILALGSKTIIQYKSLQKIQEVLKKTHLFWLNASVSSVAAIGAIYIFVLKIIILKTWCIWCAIIDLILLLILVFALINLIQHYRINEEEHHMHDVVS